MDIWQVAKGFESLCLDDLYLENLHKTVEEAYTSSTVFPPAELMLKSLQMVELEQIKVVILGQDPYPTQGAAMGLAFSLNPGIKPTKSMINVVKELKSDLGIDCYDNLNFDLSCWARQGVLLLNSILTVEANKSLSHKNFNWERFTDSIIKKISTVNKGVVFILWGNFALKKANLIDSAKHLIISSPHPSPLSARRGFFGSKPFSRTNNYLVSNGNKPIDWKIN